jgi:hypothetical protein
MGSLSKPELATVIGVVSFALEFCRQPETYPVFVQWLAKQEGVDENLIFAMAGREHLYTYDRLMTEWSATLFEEIRERQDKSSDGLHWTGRL